MQAKLVAQTTWRCQEKTEMVGSWKAKIYDMHNVQMVSCRWVVPNMLRFGAIDAVVESNPLCSFPISPSFFFLFFSKLSSSFIYHVNALSLVFLNNCTYL
ncbi:unnamed protein product [Sphagnum jensenii]|uniref:Ankyrin repeat domain-containing protein n=1 Tax=Sphagnum jensenii TaxID=128206 RepID=A0ABP1BBE3_9BRYO